jgi:hypothetical protein
MRRKQHALSELEKLPDLGVQVSEYPVRRQHIIEIGGKDMAPAGGIEGVQQAARRDLGL